MSLRIQSCQCHFSCKRSSRLLQYALTSLAELVEWPLNEMWRITKSCSCQRMSASTRPVTSDCTNRDHYSSPASQRTGRGCVNPFFCVVILAWLRTILEQHSNCQIAQWSIPCTTRARRCGPCGDRFVLINKSQFLDTSIVFNLFA